ncbi:DNRLRE domain-containing protein [Herbaspirillum sp. SJZ107]|uniref:DNRLRE domain-containing protein n=1 Tax=Herbaspirillum sp. SJZ107 TaxID=2572881 RepID=UPI001168E678|nr:DNRLRE domain-containing protein [Herbaspirillum sp. SJZ107]TQK05558.1 hypothetical protein FBX97_4535 [Herbaspirillum sp. SJZ107]
MSRAPMLSNPVRARRRESGVLALTVALLLAVMAAAAFGMHRAAGMDVQAVSAEYDRRSAAYLAEAGVAAGKWYNQIKCGNAVPSAFSLVPGATLNINVAKVAPHQIAVSATATTAAGSTSTLVRNPIDIYNLGSTEQKALGGGVRDTYIDASLTAPKNTDTSLVLSSQSNALLFWDTKDIPKDSMVLSAFLTLVQNGSSGEKRTVNLHRVTTQWDDKATWTTPRPGVAWNGGDYDPQVIASFDARSDSSYTLDLTALVSAWYNGTQPVYGMLLRLPNPGQGVTFYSREAPTVQEPALNVTFSKLCP